MTVSLNFLFVILFFDAYRCFVRPCESSRARVLPPTLGYLLRLLSLIAFVVFTGIIPYAVLFLQLVQVGHSLLKSLERARFRLATSELGYCRPSYIDTGRLISNSLFVFLSDPLFWDVAGPGLGLTREPLVPPSGTFCLPRQVRLS